MFRIAICDDCTHQVKALLDLLNTYRADKPDMELHISGFASADALLGAMDSCRVFDLFLLDILMPGQNGIQLAREIRKRDCDVPIVFLTSSADYSLDAFEVYASQYILKPVNTVKLFSVLDKVISAAKPEGDCFFMLYTPERVIKIPFASIVCMELLGRAIKVYQSNGSTVLSKTIRTSFGCAAAPLLADERFISPHKSFVINMSWIEELSGKSFVMKHDICVPIPRYKYAESKAKYFAWISRHGLGKMGSV